MTIHFTDGSKLSVSFPEQIQDSARMASMIENALDANPLAIDVSGQLFVVPVNNVKYLQLHPTPEKLPDTVIRGGLWNRIIDRCTRGVAGCAIAYHFTPFVPLCVGCAIAHHFTPFAPSA